MHERIEQQKFACDKTQDPRQARSNTVLHSIWDINLNTYFQHIKGTQAWKF